jgi:hypothetical protein
VTPRNAKSIEELYEDMFENTGWILISQRNLQRGRKVRGQGQGGGMRWMSSMTGGGGNL